MGAAQCDRLAGQVDQLRVSARVNDDFVGVRSRVNRFLYVAERIAGASRTGSRAVVVVDVPDICMRDSTED
jgi:hypothetical protein